MTRWPWRSIVNSAHRGARAKGRKPGAIGHQRAVYAYEARSVAFSGVSGSEGDTNIGTWPLEFRADGIRIAIGYGATPNCRKRRPQCSSRSSPTCNVRWQESREKRHDVEFR
jgi:hypothetical protein